MVKATVIQENDMKRSEFKKQSFESKFDRKYCCCMANHSGASKVKTANRRLARTKLKEQLHNRIKDDF